LKIRPMFVKIPFGIWFKLHFHLENWLWFHVNMRLLKSGISKSWKRLWDSAPLPHLLDWFRCDNFRRKTAESHADWGVEGRFIGKLEDWNWSTFWMIKMAGR
jgi:hypothetical protein